MGNNCSTTKINSFQNITEPQNKSSNNNSWYNWCKNLCQNCNSPLKRILILFCNRFTLFFRNSFNPRYRCKIIVKRWNIISDNHLKLPSICKHPFNTWNIFNGFLVCFRLIIQYKSHPRRTVSHSCNIFFTAYILQQFLSIIPILPHNNKPLPFKLVYICFYFMLIITLYLQYCKRFILYFFH